MFEGLALSSKVDDAIRFVSSKQKEGQQQQISSLSGEKAKANDLVIEHDDNSRKKINSNSTLEIQQQQTRLFNICRDKPFWI
jgi:hypothetical protein